MHTTTLYRPVGPAEVKLIEESGLTRFPPRDPAKPIFLPVVNRAYAVKVVKGQNAKEPGSMFLVRFDVRTDFLVPYERHVAGVRYEGELWAPAEDLDALNGAIVGTIDIVQSFGKRA